MIVFFAFIQSGYRGNKQVRRSFFQCSLCHIINLLLSKLARSRWLGIGLVLFLRFMDLDFASVHKNAKTELGQYPAILTWRLVNNIYIFARCRSLDLLFSFFFAIIVIFGIFVIFVRPYSLLSFSNLLYLPVSLP